MREVADAYNFHLCGTESLGGREAWVIDAEPRPGYEPHMKDAKFLPKFRGPRVDRQERCRSGRSWMSSALTRCRVGLFLARIHKGSRIEIEQTRVNDEVWLPQHVGVKVDARVALLKEYNMELEQTFRDYKKFRATTKILAVEDVQKK